MWYNVHGDINDSKEQQKPRLSRNSMHRKFSSRGASAQKDRPSSKLREDI